LLQPQIPLAALFVVSLLRQGGAGCSLYSEAFGGPHSRASDSSAGALQHFLPCDATMLISSYTIKFFDLQDGEADQGKIIRRG
jgi:hypothetical protein